MDPQVYMLPLCIALTVLGIVLVVLTWRFGRRRGIMLQMIGLTLAPVGLYLSGLLLIVWNFGAAVVEWVNRVVFSPMIWAGVGFLGLAVLLWVIGGIWATRAANKGPKPDAGQKHSQQLKGGQSTAGGKQAPAVRGGAQPAVKAPAGDADDDLDEIEELLRRRGIE